MSKATSNSPTLPPAPWQVNRNSLADPSVKFWPAIFDDGEDHFIGSFFISGRNGDIEEARAIARLIAASPDLLYACQEVEQWLMDRIGTGAVESCVPSLRAAIAKATGASTP